MGRATPVEQPVTLDLSKAQPIAEPQGAISRFSERLAQSAGIPTTGKEVGEAAMQTGMGLISPALPMTKQSIDFIKNLFASGKSMVGEVGEAARNISEGGPIGANIGKAGAGIMDTYLAASPLGGQIIENVGSDVASRNYAGAAGSATGALIQAALLKASGKAAQIGSKNLPEIRANNLDVALSVGGRPKGVDVHAEVASPIAEAYARKAPELGLKPKDFAGFGQKYIPFVKGAGRKIYENGLKLAKAVKDEYAQIWNEKVIGPVKDFPGKAMGEAAIKDLRAAMAKDRELAGFFTNIKTQKLMAKFEAYIREKSETIGSLDDARKELNKFSSSYFSAAEQAQLRATFGKKGAAATDRAIRSNLYKGIEEAYGPEATGKLRSFQKEHGAAIEAFNMMEDAARQLSGAVSREAAPAPVKEQIGRFLGRITTPSPAHAVGEVSGGFLTPSQIRTFGANMAKVIDPRGVKAGPVESPVPVHPRRPIGLLGPAPWITPTPPDTSYVRGWDTSEPMRTGARQLPPARFIDVEPPDYIPTGEPARLGITSKGETRGPQRVVKLSKTMRELLRKYARE